MNERQTQKPERLIKRDFFISFNKADVESALMLRSWLEDAGYSTFMQHPDFHAGSNFVLKMDEGIKTCDRLIAVLSPDYLAADFPQPEWAAFFAKDPRGELGLVVGVRITPCDVDGLLGTIRYIDLARVDDGELREKFLNDIKGLPKSKNQGSRRKTKSVAASGTPQKADAPDAPPQQINVDGNVEHLAGRDMTVNHFHKPTKRKVVLERRDTWISDAQAAEIKSRMKDYAEFRFEVSKGKLTIAKAFSYSWSDFNKDHDIPRYDALPAELFESALLWFRQEKGKLTRKLRKIDRPAWRNARIGSIKKAMKKMNRENSDYYPEVAIRLKMKSLVSLTTVTDRDLQRIYTMALRDAGESDEDENGLSEGE